MGHAAFRFKQFTICQAQTAMKVGTDGVLLGAWVEANASIQRVLDIGTGTGLIALMLAQRMPQAEVWGVDLESVDEARANCAASPWADRLRMVQSPIQQFEAEPFDLIVANPPYFVESLLCPDAGRTTARHTVSLSFEELRDAMDRLLTPAGHLALILPIEAAARFEELCRGRFEPIRRTAVRTTPRHPAKRMLLELVRCGRAQATLRSDELLIGTGRHEEYTEQYRTLTGDFYLKF